MSRIIISLSAALILASAQAGAAWASVHHRAHAQSSDLVVTFRVHVAQLPPAGTTFWVAYGPVAGQFGLVSLRSIGNHVYQAQRSFPATGRTTFAYLAGQGAVSTAFGQAPGDPVQTIVRVGPIAVDHFHPAQVEWRPAVG